MITVQQTSILKYVSENVLGIDKGQDRGSCLFQCGATSLISAGMQNVGTTICI